MNLLPHRVVPWLGWAGVLLVAAWAYWPGLSGGFLFDDFVNLDALGATGPVDDFETLLRYLTSGKADPTGRPLSMLSFLVDARDWPADPYPFLRTNLIIHLVNGSLLALLIRSLGRGLGDDTRHASWVAVLAAGAWLLHPLFVSTTLYVVQREAMLPATFVFAGLLAYSHGRQDFASTGGQRGLGMMTSGIVLATLLATLSKANGMLLPLLALVLEATIFKTLPRVEARRETLLRRVHRLILVLPSLAIAAFLLSHLSGWNQQLGMRPWTIGQRVLTEARVLIDYIQLLVVPRSVSTGLYNEDYLVSKSAFDPWQTLPALLLVIGLVFFGWRMRQRAPALAAGVLFFLAGHVLESSVIPLEIYFEHRNYLPAALLAWPLFRALLSARISRLVRAAAALCALLLLALTTFQRTQVWGDSAQLAALWAARNPSSSRAQSTAADAEIRRGRPDLAVVRLAREWQRRPHDLQIALNYINARCAEGRLPKEDAIRLNDTLQHSDIGTLLVRQWLERALTMAVAGRCRGLDMEVFRGWLSASQRNPLINTDIAREKSFPPLLALLALENGQPDLALSYFDRALLANLQPETAAGQAATLASRGYFEQALKHLNRYEAIKNRRPPPGPGMARVHEWVLDRQSYWPRELALLRRNIELEIAASAQAKGSADAN